MIAGDQSEDSVHSQRQGSPVEETIHYRKQLSLPLQGGNSHTFTADTAMREGAQGIVKKLPCV